MPDLECPVSYTIFVECVLKLIFSLANSGEIGNGRATAILLARQGAKVALVDYNTEWAEETKQMIESEGGTSEVVQADVTDEESCRKAVEKTVELFGTVHILVNIGECLIQLPQPQEI